MNQLIAAVPRLIGQTALRLLLEYAGRLISQ